MRPGGMDRTYTRLLMPAHLVDLITLNISLGVDGLRTVGHLMAVQSSRGTSGPFLIYS